MNSGCRPLKPRSSVLLSISLFKPPPPPLISGNPTNLGRIFPLLDPHLALVPRTTWRRPSGLSGCESWPEVVLPGLSSSTARWRCVREAGLVAKPAQRRGVGRVRCFVHEEKENSSSGEDFQLRESGGVDGDFDKFNVEEHVDEKKDWRSRARQVLDDLFISKNDSWTVPWTLETVIQVMLLWIASFWFVGSWMIPFLAHAAGFSKETLTNRGQALYSLLTDIAEGLAGIAIIHRCLSRFRPLPAGWFCFSLKGSWHFDVGLGCLLFPLVNFLSQLNINLVPLPHIPPVGVSSVEQSIFARDPVAMALYAVVVSVCAPVWEEIIFRGFLLPSLTRYMPLGWSIVFSSVAFALAHFNSQRLLPLVFLGVVMGAVFARSRNLLASMLLHSLWNGFVFLDLMK